MTLQIIELNLKYQYFVDYKYISILKMYFKSKVLVSLCVAMAPDPTSLNTLYQY